MEAETHNNQTLKPTLDEVKLEISMARTYLSAVNTKTCENETNIISLSAALTRTVNLLETIAIALPRSSDTEPPKLSERWHFEIVGSSDAGLQQWYDATPEAKDVSVSVIPCENNILTQSHWLIGVTFRITDKTNNFQESRP